jgi:hypothetical protein
MRFRNNILGFKFPLTFRDFCRGFVGTIRVTFNLDSWISCVKSYFLLSTMPELYFRAIGPAGETRDASGYGGWIAVWNEAFLQ